MNPIIDKYPYVFLDDGSLWKASQGSMWTCWKQCTYNNDKNIYDIEKVLKYNKDKIMPVGFCYNNNNKPYIYNQQFPYSYMNTEERIKHGYIQCKCCRRTDSCGKIVKKNEQKSSAPTKKFIPPYRRK